MNKVFLIGRLTKDPEISETTTGLSVCHFGLAVNRKYSNEDGKQEADFFNVTAWRKTADNVARYTEKGSQIAVSGSIQIRNYEDKNGNKRIACDIIANEIKFLDPNPAGNSERQDKQDKPKKTYKKQLELIDDEDIPF